MAHNSLVSVIIPLYNTEKYIGAAIDSVLAQTWQNREIIIVNDGSTDQSLAAANRYAAADVKVITQAGSGAAAARNLGLLEARGEYIQFLDADDLLSPDKIELQVTALKNAPAKLAVCSTVHFNHDADPALFLPSPYENDFLQDTDDPAEFLTRLWGGYDNRGSMIQPNAWLVPAELIGRAGNWDERLSLDDDGEFFCRVILHSGGIIKTGGLSYYRKHPGSNLSAQKNREALNSLLRAALSKKKELLSRSQSAEAQHAIYRLLYDVFIKSYPAYPEIYKTAGHELPPAANAYYPPLGGRSVNLIARMLGIKTARWMQYLLTQH